MDKLNVEEMFLCKNCTLMIDDPHESECCGILYCQTCINDLSYTNCTLCKKLFKFRKNIFAKNLLKKVELKCRHLCGGKFTYDEMKSHSFRCDNKMFKCTIDYCYCVEKKKKMIEHSTLFHSNEILILMENYEEFQSAIEKIKSNPIDSRRNNDDRFKESSIDDYNRYDENFPNNIGNVNGFHPSIRSYPIEDNHHYNDYGYSEHSENTYERNSRYLSDSHERNSANNEFSF